MFSICLLLNLRAFVRIEEGPLIIDDHFFKTGFLGRSYRGAMAANSTFTTSTTTFTSTFTTTTTATATPASSVSSQYVHSRFVNVRDLNDFDVARLHYRDDANDVAESVLRASKITLSPFGLHNVSDYFTRKIKLTIVRKSFIASKYLEWDFSRVSRKNDSVATEEKYVARVDDNDGAAVNGDLTVDALLSNENISKILDDVVCCIIDCWNKYFLPHRSTINW